MKYSFFCIFAVFDQLFCGNMAEHAVQSYAVGKGKLRNDKAKQPYCKAFLAQYKVILLLGYAIKIQMEEPKSKQC